MHRSRSSLSRGLLRVVVLLALLPLVGDAARAILYVPMADLDLARGADLVVEAQVVGEAAARDDRAVTEYEVAILRVLAGTLDQPSPLIVSSPGRVEPDGSGLDVPGAPRFAPGEHVILLLGAARGDGTRPIHQLVLGAFHRVETAAGAFAVRDLTGAIAVGADDRRTPAAAGAGQLARAGEVEPIRDYDRFADWLAAIGTGAQRESDYLVAAPAPSDAEGSHRDELRIDSPYAFLTDPPSRWFQFDARNTVTLHAVAGGQDGVPGDLELTSVQNAIAAWNADPGSNIRLAYGGTTGSSGGLERRDSVNAVLWNDPYGEVTGTFSCNSGGILGIGGGWYSSSQDFVNGDGATVRGKALIEADVVINDGAGCYLQGHSGRDGDEILAHEIGHGLGFSHSSVNSALMHSGAHGDGRGADLRPDDQAGARYLYPDFSYTGGGGGGGGGGTGGGSPGSFNFSASSATGAEGATVTLTVRRAGGSTGAASVQYSTVAGSAAAGDDFAATSGTLAWGAGQSGGRQIVVGLEQDSRVEGGETFEVRLSNASGATLGSPNRVTVTIADDDSAPSGGSSFVFTQQAWSANEKQGALDVAVRRSGSLAGAAAVDVVARGGSATAGQDFSGVPVRLSWGDGQGGTRSARLSLLDDSLHEGEETVALGLANPSAGASIGAAKDALITIADDEAPAGAGALRLTSTTFTGLEGGVLEVSVERLGGTQGAVSAKVSGEEASATDGSDFRAAERTLQWRSGESGLKTARFELLDDGMIEGAESFGVSLGSPSGGAVISTPARATAIVRDDDFRVQQEVAGAPGSSGARVAYGRDGRSALAWQASDGAGDGVFVQLFAASGSADGASFRVNGAAAGDQRLPAITFDAVDRLVTVWVEEAGSAFRTGDGRVMVAASVGARLLARVWSGAARAASATFELASDPEDIRSIEVSSDGSGRTWVVWEAAGRAFVRRFDAEGPLGGAIELGDGDQPAIDVAVAGEAAAVWRSGSRLRLKRFDAGGNAAPAFTVADAVGLDQPDVAVAADGSSVVVWAARGVGDDVYLRRYDRAGAALGAAERASAFPTGDQGRPRVESNSIGDFSIAWEDRGRDGVAVRTFDLSGAPQGTEIVLETPLAGVAAVAPEVAIGEHDEVAVAYDRRSPLGLAAGVALRRVEAQILDDGCRSGSGRLCTHRGRFEVRALWRDAAGNRGEGTGVALGADTGYFWFFDEANVELVVKALDGCGVNDRFWVFAGGLTDLEVLLLVDDLESGHSQVYYNPPGAGFAPIRDASAFSSCDVALGVHGAGLTPDVDGLETSEWAEWPEWPERLAADAAMTTASFENDVRVAQAAVCRADDRTLCLGGSRFQLRVDWTDAAAAGAGHPVGITADTGAFWFFGPDNVEVVVKVLDACSLNDKLWVFIGGLTDVGVEMTVVDKSNGRRKTYSSPRGTAFQPVRDVVAFPCR